MRIVVWNINGLRTLKGYQPWYKLPDWEACLEHLSADIACFQETKMTRKQLTEPMCILPSYNAFFNFHPTKGYSGTVTYVRKSVSIPLKAEQAITGRVRATNVASHRGAISDEPIGCIPADTRDDVEPQIWNALDEEGRCVALDLGLFVLFNVYCPNETGPERLDYKMTYYQCLAERAHRLIAAGRQVMIVGDMNIIRDPIDHCDPEQSLKEHGWDHFHQHPARSWFQTFLAPQGKFHDVGRMFHPQRHKMFTCWNTLIDARPANYGVRLDYTLVTEGLLGWVKGADIQADVYGSDHCPIYIDLHDEREIDGKTVTLRELMHGGESRLPPALAACHYDEFSGKQRKLASFFGAKKSTTSLEKKVSAEAAPSIPSQVSVSSQETDAAKASVAATQDESQGGSLAESLFSLHAQQEGMNVQAPPAIPLLSVSPATTGQSPATKRAVPSPKRTPSPTKGKDTAKAKNSAALKGQTSLQSFFAKPSSSSTTPPAAPTQPDTSAEDEICRAPAVDVDELDEISTFPPAGGGGGGGAAAAPIAVGSSKQEPSAAGRVDASLAWGAIFSPLPAPLCRLHCEPCRAWTVNKPGPNHGRKFWLCSRPVGPGYEKSGRAKGDVNPEFRCNFFVWDSDRRGDKKRAANDAGATAGGKFFTEVGRERDKKNRHSQEPTEGAEEMGTPWGPHKRVKTADAR